MISERVENVGAFVDKYLDEYKVAGIRLHTWRRLEKLAAGMWLPAGPSRSGGLVRRGRDAGDGPSHRALREQGLGILILLVDMATG